MNDEKYIYFTERIQNMLCKPDILNMMKKTEEKAASKVADPSKSAPKELSTKKEEEKKEEPAKPDVDRENLNQADKLKFEQDAFEKRKKARNENL
tara:strand:+ start:764 stop:1048 length:285 start_codon:yes stop_codon:yes gene_type:complete